MKPQQDEIDRLMRQRLLDADQSGGDWDLPSDHVWTAVEHRIGEKDRDRGAIWWIFGGLLLMAIGVFGLIQLRQSATATDLGITNSTPSSIVDKEVIPDTQSSFSASASDASDKIPLQNDESAIPQSGLGPVEKISSLPSDHSESERSRTKGIPARAQEYPTMPEKKNMSRDPVSNPSLTETQLVVAQQQISSEKTTNSSSPIPENALSNEKAGNSTHTDRIVDSYAIPLLSAPIVREAEMLPTPLANAHVSFLHTELSNITTQKSSLPTVDILPVISGPTPSLWSVTASISPSLGTRRIVVPNAQPRVRRNLLLQQEEPAIQTGFSVSAIHELGARWSIEGGLEYSRFLLRSSSTQQIRYSRIGETQNARGNFENRFHLNLNTSYGEVNTEIVVERSSDSQFEEHRFINLSLETSQSMQVLQFPVSMRYDIPVGSWSASFHGGLSANVLLENSFEIQAVRSLDSEIVQTRAVRNAPLSSYKDFALGYQFGIGFEIPLHRQLSILAGPTVSGYLQPVYQNRHVVIYPMMFELQAGIRYRL